MFEKLPPGWKRVHERRYVRQDGAVVLWDERTPYSNPDKPTARMWTAWEPDPGERYLSVRPNSRGRT